MMDNNKNKIEDIETIQGSMIIVYSLYGRDFNRKQFLISSMLEFNRWQYDQYEKAVI